MVSRIANKKSNRKFNTQKMFAPKNDSSYYGIMISEFNNVKKWEGLVLYSDFIMAS